MRNLFALSKVLEERGLQIFKAEDGEKALALLREGVDADIILMDIGLPGLSGLDLQSALGQARRDIPIVFLTGYGSVPTSVRAMKGGAVDFLEKPFNDQQLLDCVQRALERMRAALA